MSTCRVSHRTPRRIMSSLGRNCHSTREFEHLTMLSGLVTIGHSADRSSVRPPHARVPAATTLTLRACPHIAQVAWQSISTPSTRAEPTLQTSRTLDPTVLSVSTDPRYLSQVAAGVVVGRKEHALVSDGCGRAARLATRPVVHMSHPHTRERRAIRALANRMPVAEHGRARVR